MRRFWTVVVAALAFGAVATVSAPGAHAAVRTPSAKFCQAIEKIGNPEAFSDAQQLAMTKRFAKTFRAASKSASPKVKQAMLQMVDYFEFYASVDGKLSPKQAAARVDEFAEAFGVYRKAAEACN